MKPWKALYAAAVAAISTAITAAPDGFTTVEILTTVLSALVAGGGVYQISNGPTDPPPPAPAGP